MAYANKETIALDTNFLTAIAQFKIDVFDEIRHIVAGNLRFTVPVQVRKELDKLVESNAKMRGAVAIATLAMKKNNVVTSKIEAKDADTALVKMGKKGTIIATNDHKLKKKIKKFGGRILYIRQRSYVELG